MIDAQTARTGAGANTALMQQQLQQLQQLASERTALQADVERLKKDLASAQKERDVLKAGQQTLKHRMEDSGTALDRTGHQLQSTEQELAQYKQRMQELIAKFRETVQVLHDAETQNTTAKQSLTNLDVELKTCRVHNDALYKLNEEVLARLEKRGFWSGVAQTEPFTRIKRTQLENYVDESHARADEEHLAPAGAQPADSVPASIPQDRSQR